MQPSLAPSVQYNHWWNFGVKIRTNSLSLHPPYELCTRCALPFTTLYDLGLINCWISLSLQFSICQMSIIKTHFACLSRLLWDLNNIMWGKKPFVQNKMVYKPKRLTIKDGFNVSECITLDSYQPERISEHVLQLRALSLPFPGPTCRWCVLVAISSKIGKWHSLYLSYLAEQCFLLICGIKVTSFRQAWHLLLSLRKHRNLNAAP